MKKMNEIMELLTDEIDGFNRSITKLEELSKKWDNPKIRADTSNMDYYIKDFLRQQERVLETYKRSAIETGQTIKSSVLVPRWLIALFCIAIITMVLAVGYFGYHFIKFEENKIEAYRQGREEAIFERRGYFSDHPVIYKDFQRWSEKKDSTLNRK